MHRGLLYLRKSFDNLWTFATVRRSTDVTNLAKFAPKPSGITHGVRYRVEGGTIRGFHNSSFDPPTLVMLEAAFDEARLTLKSIGNTTVRPDELARSVFDLRWKASAIRCDYIMGRWKA
jgi:hypothetical protein